LSESASGLDPDSSRYLDPDPFETIDVPFLILLFLVCGHKKKLFSTGSDLNLDVEIRESKEEKRFIRSD
jgi:hypothetical protein